MEKRTKILKTILFVAIAVILVRLFVIQIIEHDAWVARAEDEHIVQRTIKAKRGEIYMMDGDEPSIVVMNETVWTVIVDPLVANAEKTKEVISNAVGDKVVADWQDVFADKTRRYYVVAKGVKQKEIEKIQEAELAGIWYSKGQARVYPEGQMAASLLGFVNAEGEGQYGVEGALDDELGGEDGILKTVTDVNNIALSIGSDNIRVPAKDGKNIVLSIDKNVQSKLETFLQQQIDSTVATNAAGLVMDPTTGEIWAMANLPSYDAAKYAEVKDASVFINTPLESAYEPGSMCKSFSFAAAVDTGKITPTATYYNTGSMTIDGWPIENADSSQKLGEITMATGLAYSLNTASMTALMRLGDSETEITQKSKDRLYDYYYNKFGLGQYTGIELYEVPGYITKPDAEDAYNSRYANMSFGQGLTLTMMQVAAGFSSVINGGEYYRPTIVAGEVTEDGDFIYNQAPEMVRRTISPESSATMREMLRGTRQVYRVQLDKDGYLVGGKTGTSQGIKDGKYTFDETTASYVGFGGAEGELPKYVIMVKIWGENQKLGGEADAMPVFNKMSDFMIDYLQIKPGEKNV